MKEKILKELKLIFWTSLYFILWFGALMLLKVLLLQEHKIEVYETSMAIVGALVVAKTVLLLQNAPVWGKASQPAILVILKRTLFYLAGVFIILVLERALESRHEYGGFLNALKALPESADRFHILVNLICISGALFFFNLWWLMKKHLGKQGIRNILLKPVPEKTKDQE